MNIPNYRFGKMVNGEPTVTAEGWDIFTQLWFLSVPAFILGFTLAAFVAWTSYEAAIRIDHENEINKLKKEFKKQKDELELELYNANWEKNNAENAAKSSYEDFMKEARFAMQKAKQDIGNAERFREKCEKEVKTAKQEAKEATQNAARANKKLKDARYAIKKYKSLRELPSASEQHQQIS